MRRWTLAMAVAIFCISLTGAARPLITTQIISDPRIFDLTTRETPYYFRGRTFETTISLVQDTAFGLTGEVQLMSLRNPVLLTTPVTGSIRVAGSGPARVSLSVPPGSQFIRFNMNANGNAHGLSGSITINVTGTGAETMRVRFVPANPDWGAALSDIRPTNVAGTVILGTGDLWLPFAQGTRGVRTSQTANGDRFTLSAEGIDFRSDVSGIGQLPVVGRLNRSTVRIGTQTLVLSAGTVSFQATDIP